MRTQNHFPTHASGSSDESDRADLAIKTRARTKKPPMYKVLLLNDDYTPMGFVTEVLETVFNKSHAEAMRIMMHVHRKGAGLCGVYTFDVAETKVAQVLQTARAAQYPLQCIMERA